MEVLLVFKPSLLINFYHVKKLESMNNSCYSSINTRESPGKIFPTFYFNTFLGTA